MGQLATTAHVWTIELVADAARASSLLDNLSGEERVRAARLRTTDSRLRFIIVHGAVRTILARYLGSTASGIRVDSSPAGKPFLPNAGLSFNLSYSDEIAVCALAGAGPIGVDVERIRPMSDAEEMVKSYFAPGEARAYAELPSIDRMAAFFSTWTRKEALVKAVGDGTQVPLDSFVVDIAPSAAEPHLAIDRRYGDWRLWSFEPAPGYAAAVASGPGVLELQRFHFDEESLRLVQPNVTSPSAH
jgi:4'-phosphopantetheinyl transferase